MLCGSENRHSKHLLASYTFYVGQSRYSISYTLSGGQNGHYKTLYAPYTLFGSQNRLFIQLEET